MAAAACRVAERRLHVEGEHERGGEVHVEHRAGALHAELVRQPTGLEQPGRAGVVEHVDGAELVQSPQAPDREAGLGCGPPGLLERGPSRLEVAGPVGPPDELEGVAADRGRAPGRGQRRFGVVEGDGDLTGVDRHLGPQDIRPRRPAAGESLGVVQVGGCERPAAGGHRRVGEHEVHLGAPCCRPLPLSEGGDHAVAGRDRLVDPAGQGERVDEELPGLGCLLAVAAQVSGPAQGLHRRGEGATVKGGATRRQQQGGGATTVAAVRRQIGRDVAPAGREAGMSSLDRSQRRAGQRGPPRRQQGGHHRVPGEGVAKPEPVAVDRQQQRRHRGVERGIHVALGDGADAGEEAPVEVAPEDGGRLDDRGALGPQLGQPGPHRLGERGRDSR